MIWGEEVGRDEQSKTDSDERSLGSCVSFATGAGRSRERRKEKEEEESRQEKGERNRW